MHLKLLEGFFTNLRRNTHFMKIKQKNNPGNPKQPPNTLETDFVKSTPLQHIVVQKFGGTSLATPEGREKAVQQILNCKAKGHPVVVVVSAMGRHPEPYATDTLIQLMSTIRTPPNPAIKDLLLSCGEVISACIMGQLLEATGTSVAVLPWHTLGIVTDAYFGDALPRLADVTRVKEELTTGKIVVLPGFQGNTSRGDITTLGRGGSDLTAVVIGAALGAENVEIFTDVDGVKVADPNILPGAPTLADVTYEELGELAYHGAKVVHSKAVALATQERVPLTIKATNSNSPGTRVVHKLTAAGNIVTGIAHVGPVAFAKAVLAPGQSPKDFRDILDLFARSRISLDMIHISQDHAYFIFKEELLTRGKIVLDSFPGTTTVESGYAKVSIVGAGMWGIPGIMAQVLDALQEACIPLLHSTDSYITISCLVPNKDLSKAVEVLADKFKLSSTSYVESR